MKGASGTFGYRQFRLGDRDIYSLHDGHTDRPVRDGMVTNASAAEISAALRAAGLPPDHVRSHFTALALRDRDRLTLIDTGTGGSPVYGPDCGFLTASMMVAGLNPGNVSAILITHLHGDHIYGLMDPATLQPRFPDAEIIVPAVDLHWWTQPGVAALDLGPTRVGLADRIAATIAVWPNVRTFEAGSEVMPGVHAIAAYGHSPGHTAFLVMSGATQLFMTADVAQNPALFLRHPHWRSALDQDPATAAETRRRLFDRIASERGLVTGTHWGFSSVGTVARDGDGYAFEPMVG